LGLAAAELAELSVPGCDFFSGPEALVALCVFAVLSFPAAAGFDEFVGVWAFFVEAVLFFVFAGGGPSK
jgi:hypothetical protein